jgi:hypothetical protein
MYYQTLIVPGVFEIRKHKGVDEFYLEQKDYYYKVPDKLYGDMGKYVDFYWNSFMRTNFVGGLLLTGQKGSGKTMISATLCNRAIARGLRVVEITNIQFSSGLLKFLDELDKVVLFFDEFGKNFNTHQQDKMLTLLSNISGKERLVFITENDPRRISEFIRNRPGRVKYSLHFNKLPRKVVEEYCAEFNVSEGFYKDFIDAYNSIVTFQFDHLIAIVEEHLSNRDLSFDELVQLLNVEGLTGVKTLIFTMGIELETGDSFTISNISPDKITIDDLEANRLYIYGNITINREVKEKPKQQDQQQGFSFNTNTSNTDTRPFRLNTDSIVEVTDEDVIFESEGYRYVFKIERI